MQTRVINIATVKWGMLMRVICKGAATAPLLEQATFPRTSGPRLTLAHCA